MGNGQCGTAVRQLFQTLSYDDFIFIVQSAGGFVQNENGRVFQKDAGNGNALLLSA